MTTATNFYCVGASRMKLRDLAKRSQACSGRRANENNASNHSQYFHGCDVWSLVRRARPCRDGGEGVRVCGVGESSRKYKLKQNPLANDRDAVAAGKVLFEEHCEDCHGA